MFLGKIGAFANGNGLSWRCKPNKGDALGRKLGFTSVTGKIRQKWITLYLHCIHIWGYGVQNRDVVYSLLNGLKLGSFQKKSSS